MSNREAKLLKTALYARYSNDDVQKDSSIEDQWAELEKVAKRFNLQLDAKHYYCDRGISGTEALDQRPGLTVELLGAAERGEFEAVLVEATDRLSRDESDTHWLKKVFAFCGIKVFTRNGEVSDLQWTFEGYGNQDYIRKLQMRVKRGHDAAARDGRIATASPMATISGSIRRTQPSEA